MAAALMRRVLLMDECRLEGRAKVTKWVAPNFIVRSVVLLAAACLLSVPGYAQGDSDDRPIVRTASNGAQVLEMPAAPGKGFNFPYLLFLPPNPGSAPLPYLLVEPNNSGLVSDDPDAQRSPAIDLVAVNSDGNSVALKLGTPLLMPIFPRPPLGGSNLYTHALSRQTILVAAGPLKRIDLQLVAMIGDAKKRLAAQGRPVGEKVLLEGFSASGMFVSRFTFLHPEMVAAAAFGGVNSFIMLPTRMIEGHRLNYPVGLADYSAITGHEFDKRAFDAVPQFAFMGESDSNDAVRFDDAYSHEDRKLIFSLLGQEMPQRWASVQRIYRAHHASVEFVTFPNIGHGTDGRIHTAIASFFMSAVAKNDPVTATKQP